MRVLVTGSRDWHDEDRVWDELTKLYIQWRDGQAGRNSMAEFVVVHGMARGADTFADNWAKRMHTIDPRVKPDPHPVSDEEWNRFGLGAGNMRNTEMVSAGADYCLAFPSIKARGTVDCMKKARRAKVPVKDCSLTSLW